LLRINIFVEEKKNKSIIFTATLMKHIYHCLCDVASTLLFWECSLLLSILLLIWRNWLYQQHFIYYWKKWPIYCRY